MKIIIIGSSLILEDIWHIAKGLQTVNDDLTIAPIFTTKLEMRNKTGEREYYMSNEEVELSYKNNAFMWVKTNKKFSSGVTMPDMYNSNVFIMTYGDFNNISNPVIKELSNDDLIICVIDESQTKKDPDELMEAKAAYERIYEHHYLYFLDEKPRNITNVILKYIVASSEEREEIENSLNS